MSDDTRDRALILTGRTATLAAVATAWAEALEASDRDQGLRDFSAWLEHEGATANAELDKIRREIGMPSEFH